MTRRRSGVLLALVSGSLALSGCGLAGPSDGPRGQLEEAMARWEALGMADYSVEVERICFCPPAARGPVEVRVEGGSVVRRTYVSDGSEVAADAASWFPAVDGVFAAIADALDRNAYRLEVTYDPGTGVPVDVWIDYRGNVADEELGFRLTLPVPLGG